MKKYQVFVSSTYDDLKNERNQVIKAILEMGHIPVGMEMFSAADEEQWKIISRQIDESDYYVIIVAHRYGSMSGTISYTEKEFDYALDNGIPIYGFFLDDNIEPLAKNVDKDRAKKIALSKFKVKLKQRPVSFWKSADDLHGKVSIALMKAFNTNPRVGWTRSSSAGGLEITAELSRLSKENAELRALVAKAEHQEENDRKKILEEKINLMKSVNWTVCIREEGSLKWDIKVKKTMFSVYLQIAPELMGEASIEDAAAYLALMNIPDGKKHSHVAPIGLNHIKMYFADFACLELVETSKRKHAVADKSEYWSLTEEGKEILKIARVETIFENAGRTLSNAATSSKKL